MTSSPPQRFTLRAADPDADAAAMLPLFAASNELDSVNSLCFGADDLRRDLRRGVCTALVADGEPEPGRDRAASLCGLVLFYGAFRAGRGCGLHVEDVSVAAPCRRRGLGAALLQAVARRAVAMGAGRVTLQRLATNAEAAAFYERLGFRPEPPIAQFRLEGAALSAAAAKSEPGLPLALRPLRPDDCPAACALLAAWGRPGDERLEAKALRGGPVMGVAATEGDAGRLVGVCLFHAVYSTLDGPGAQLEALAVTGPARGRGVGGALVSAVARAALEESWSGVDVWLAPGDPAAGFLSRQGLVDASARHELIELSIEGAQLEALVQRELRPGIRTEL